MLKKIGEGTAGNSGIRQYVYDQTSRLVEYDETGSAVARFNYGSDRLISMWHAGEGTRFYHLDGLRSVIALTDPDAEVTNSDGTVTMGKVAARFHLDTWGNFRFPDQDLSTTANRFAFTGHVWEPEIGLYYAKARFLDPKLGRFLTQDSFLGSIDEPPCLHRYLYAQDNPTTFVDPTGQWVESAWDAFSLGVGAVSLYHNVKQGNWGMAALDTVGVVADAVALALPLVPGGAGAAIKASRAAKLAIDAVQTADQAINVGQGAAQAIDEYQQGNTGWAAGYGAMTALGLRGIGAKGGELSRDIRNLSEAEKAGVKLEAHSGDLAKAAPAEKAADVAEPLDNAVKPVRQPQASQQVPADYDGAGWAAYYQAHPGTQRSLGAAGAGAPMASKGIDFGDIPVEHHWRYERHLGRSANPLGPTDWYETAQRAWRNNKIGLGQEGVYREALGGKSKILDTPYGRRQIDAMFSEERLLLQLKTGRQSLTRTGRLANTLAIQRDAWLVSRGYRVGWILEKGGSPQLLKALDEAGIMYHVGSFLR